MHAIIFLSTEARRTVIGLHTGTIALGVLLIDIREDFQDISGSAVQSEEVRLRASACFLNGHLSCDLNED